VTGSVEAISAVTLATHNMARAVPFYEALGFGLRYGGPAAGFTSFSAGNACLNLTTEGSEREWSWWGRIIFYVADVDSLHRQALAAGLQPHAAPRDASWGERYFHITDPDGHELSFATPLNPARP
jgi:catechol 2,3-dioxygenase-like lactoylglutathione lyase family enzyme